MVDDPSSEELREWLALPCTKWLYEVIEQEQDGAIQQERIAVSQANLVLAAQNEGCAQQIDHIKLLIDRIANPGKYELKETTDDPDEYDDGL